MPTAPVSPRGVLVSTARLGAWFFVIILPFVGLAHSRTLAIACFGGIALLLVMYRVLTSDAGVEFRGSVHTLAEKAGRVSRLPAAVRYGVVIVFLAVLPAGLNNYALDIALTIGIYVLLAHGLNIVVGMAGMLNLGYIAFYAVGAYTYGILSTALGVGFWPGLVAGGVVAAVFGALLCFPTLRLRGDYLAIVTLGFGEMVRITLNNWDSLTQGPNGILGIGRPTYLWLSNSPEGGEVLWRWGGLSILSVPFPTGRPVFYYYLIAALALVTIILIGRLNQSRMGRALVAVREDEVAAEAMGVDIVRIKLMAFSFSAFIGGIAGVFFAAKQRFISPESFTFLESVLVLCMVVIGGMGSIPGVTVGAILLVLLPEFLRGFELYRMLLFGGLMAVIMIVRPQGLIAARRALIRLRTKTPAEAA